MKKFSLETLSVVLGVSLLIGAGSIEMVAYATSCTNGCSTTGVPCSGETVSICSVSGTGYQGCGGGGSSKIAWSGQTTYGTTGSGGTQKITTPKVLCRTVTPCVALVPRPGEKCNKQTFYAIYSCSTSGASATSSCTPNGSGTASEHEVSTCLVQACGEG